MGTRVSPCPGIEGTGMRGEASATRRTRLPATGVAGRRCRGLELESSRLGAPPPSGEHPDWAGTTGEAGPRGLLHRTTAATPASRLLQACTRHRPQFGPTPRLPAASAGVAAPSRTPSSLGSGEPTLSRDSAPAVPAFERPPSRLAAAAAAAAAAAVARVTALNPGRGRAGGRGGQGAGR